jgi:hypothetical protein
MENVLLTGLPRSGTTLMCHLLNKLPHSVALHEPMDPSRLGGLPMDEVLARVRAFLEAERHRILTTGRTTSKANNFSAPPILLAIRRSMANGKSTSTAARSS